MRTLGIAAVIAGSLLLYWVWSGRGTVMGGGSSGGGSGGATKS